MLIMSCRIYLLYKPSQSFDPDNRNFSELCVVATDSDVKSARNDQIDHLQDHLEVNDF